MKHRWMTPVLLALAAALLSGCGGTRPRDDVDSQPPATSTIPKADLTPFRAALEPYGEWIESGAHGAAWVPYATPAGWRPYTTGRWLATDHGWMWIGEEPWGWAAFHYGRWTLDERLGWIWIPGNTWAPAWVAWRHGQGYVGWAPLSPDVDWKRESSRDGSKELSRGIDRFAWSFVRARDFTARSVAARVVPVGRNPTILGLTVPAGRYVSAGTRVAERGFFEAGAVERPMRHRVVDAGTHRQNRAPIVHGSVVEIYRPEALKTQAPQGRGPLSQRPSGSRAQDMIERERREQKRLDERLAQERDRLRREQEREWRQRPESISEDRLRRRQKTEIEAQESYERRERGIFTHRRERLLGVTESEPPR